MQSKDFLYKDLVRPGEVTWHVVPLLYAGQRFRKKQPLIAVETDCSTFSILASFSGEVLQADPNAIDRECGIVMSIREMLNPPKKETPVKKPAAGLNEPLRQPAPVEQEVRDRGWAWTDGPAGIEPEPARPDEMIFTTTGTAVRVNETAALAGQRRADDREEESLAAQYRLVQDLEQLRRDLRADRIPPPPGRAAMEVFFDDLVRNTEVRNGETPVNTRGRR